MINFKQFLENYKTMGLKGAFNNHIQETIKNEKERQEQKKREKEN